MATLKIPYLIRKPGRHGLDRWYWQPSADLRAAGWPTRRLPAQWETFADPNALAVAAAMAAQAINDRVERWRAGTETIAGQRPARGKHVNPGSLADLIRCYQRSRFYLDKAASTRRTYAKALAALEAWAGDAPAAAISPLATEKLYVARRAGAPEMAALIMRVGQIVYSRAPKFAEAPRFGLAPGANPFAKAGIDGAAKRGMVWPADAVAAFIEAADALNLHSVGTAIALNEWLGQRPADVLALRRPARTPGKLDDGTITIVQAKTAAAVPLPVDRVPALRARIDAELARQAARGVQSPFLLLDEGTGRPWTAGRFREAFGRVRDRVAAATPAFALDFVVIDAGRVVETVKASELKFRHLRHTAVVRLAEAGNDVESITAITGHKLAGAKAILEHYLVRTRRLAANAFARRQRHERRARKEGNEG